MREACPYWLRAVERKVMLIRKVRLINSFYNNIFWAVRVRSETVDRGGGRGGDGADLICASIC